MSDDELDQIRKKKLAELQQQAALQQEQEANEEMRRREFEAQKALLMRQILESDARQRIENIRMVKPQFAERVEMALIQMFQSGQLRGAVPLSDLQLKQILTRMQGKKREFRIRK